MTAKDPIAGSATLVELLRARAGAEPERLAYTFLADGEREVDALTFGELDRRARAIGALLQRHVGAPRSGARALLCYPAGLDFVTAFFGAMYGGAVAVPAPVGEAGQLQRTLPRLVAVAKDAEPAVILTTAAGKQALEELRRIAPELEAIPILATDESPGPGGRAEDSWEDPRATGDDLSFLQYTSGSTSSPKGVMVSHANVLYTARDIDAGWRYDADSVLVSWLPIFHDMGLICGIVLPAYKGFHAYLMSPAAFIQKPLRWLAALSKYGATHSAAPNFAYDLCVRKIGPAERAGLDLSRWAVTLNSAEPVRRATIERFADAFGPCGFRLEAFCPGFGLAEATVKVTASARGARPVFLSLRQSELEHHRLAPVAEDERADAQADARKRGIVSLVGNGPAILATRVAIANPETRERLGALELGEIWVAGPCVAQGYWQRPDETEHTFHAHLADGSGPFLRTGDLGFVDAAGELFCAGRIKDLVIVRGKNLYPQDVELCAEQAHAAVRPGCSAAFAADLEGEERLVVCVELDPRKLGRDEAAARAAVPAALHAVRQAIAEEFEVLPFAVVATGPRAVPKTSSGKIQRRACRELFLSLGLDAVGLALQRDEPPARPAASAVRARILAADEAQRQRMVEFYLLSLLAPALPNADPARPELEEPLVHLGLDLLGALDWIDTLRETLGAVIPPLAFFSRLTMQALATQVLAALAQPLETAGDEPAPAAEKPSGPPRARNIEDWLVVRIAAQTGGDAADVDVHRPFSTLGLDSMLAVDLAMDLEDWLGRPLPATLVWDYPTIEAVARHLGSDGGTAAASERAPAPRASERDGAEPIAIVGMACRFPGAPNLDAFWALLANKVDAITETPESRWSADLYDPKPGRPGKVATKWGGFLDDVDLFDAAFFGISAREASRLDPQQRILLEVAYEALEHAGLSTDRLAGTSVGMFLGKSSHDYMHLQLEHLEDIDGYASTGNAASVAAGRLNYVFDWRGPSLAIDTACSSSLVAIHHARRGLLAGECDVALSGGVNLTLLPHWTISFSHAHMMAADGRCKTFDERADGYVRGEGCGIIVMKRLSDALRDRDDVLCVIRGSAVNHDGASNGITAPSGHAQQDVIRQALRDGGVAPAEIGYVEAHGTGTPLGDPIEVAALAEVLAAGRAPGRRCWIGSVKTNIGHLEPAAGAAGLIKAALALWKREIPPQIHFHALNPRIALDGTPLAIATERVPWPGADERFAGCSSFGFAGTNAHVVLGGAPAPVEAAAAPDRPQHVATLSAKSPEALLACAARLAAHLDDPGHAGERLGDLCFTLNAGRAHHAHRVALRVATREDLRVALGALSHGETPRGALRGALPDRRPARLAFLLPAAAEAAGAAAALVRALGEAGVTPARELEPSAESTATALAAGLADGCDGFVVLGADDAWSAVLAAAGDAPVIRVALGEPGPTLLDALARLYVAGVAIDWEAVDRGLPRRRLHLPTYPFERRSYWFKSKRK
jgi:acyl-CoA synthetase (AMP-forming)/AMP-acid ligase II/3-oxoacyl-(acyl-carrier-protein) synthase/acyl carrier protein